MTPGSVRPGDPSGPTGPVDPPSWRIDVDMHGLDRFVTGSPATYRVQGRAMASLGFDHTDVAGMRAGSSDDGTFWAEVPVTPGLQLVPIEVHDRATPAHMRKAHRTLLVADFLPEGQMNGGAAALTLTNEMVAEMAAPLAGEVAGLDLAAEIMRRPTLSDGGGCTTRPRRASHGRPMLTISVTPAGELEVRIVIPNL